MRRIKVGVGRQAIARRRIDADDFAIQRVEVLRAVRADVFVVENNRVGPGLRVVGTRCRTRVDAVVAGRVAEGRQQAAVGTKK